jgi:FixJ family two-component response regulator
MASLGQILIADGDGTFRNSIADLLRKEGYQCDCSSNAIVAKELLCNANYDLLIADTNMEGNSELEFVRHLPESSQGMPVILVTGFPTLKSAIESIQLPVVAYLVKPLKFEELLKQVEIAIRNHRVFKTVENIRRHLRDWNEDLKGIEDVQKGPLISAISINTFLNLTFQNISGALLDMKNLIESYYKTDPKHETCHLLDCPRLTGLKEVLIETIAVLGKTKSAFKSKDLGILRRKLEEVVKTIL